MKDIYYTQESGNNDIIMCLSLIDPKYMGFFSQIECWKESVYLLLYFEDLYDFHIPSCLCM